MGIPGEKRGFWGGDSAGDVNDDGYGDILVGMEGDYHEWIFVIQGGSSLAETIDDESDCIMTRIKYPGPGDIGQHIGMLGPGDINGDGYDDIVVTVFGDSNPAFNHDPIGGIYVFYGGQSLPQEMGAQDADVVIEGNGDPWFAYGYGSAGDFNGDGFADFAVSATGDGCPNDYDTFGGRVFLFFGGPTLSGKETADDADVIITSSTADDWFGRYINETTSLLSKTG